ncbi:MAG TPA: WG repeat-containing protein, partial [Candidatus Melainabacteria bacterium]|nr:WG repeat-containing protein [Candidatus Melainabacteria bacterium]
MDISRIGRRALFALSGVVTIAVAFPDAAMASDNLRWGFVNKEGKMIIQPQFLEAGTFSEGLAPVKTDAGWGYLDRSGKVVLEGFDEAGVFSEGLAAVKIPSNGPLVEKFGNDSAALWGFIDSTGNFVIKPQFQDAGPFREGLSAVASGGKYGFIDRDGTFEIKPQFDLACNFSGNRAAILINEQTGSLSLKVG